MRQLIIIDGILQRGGDMRLPYYGSEVLWSVFPC